MRGIFGMRVNGHNGIRRYSEHTPEESSESVGGDIWPRSTWTRARQRCSWRISPPGTWLRTPSCKSGRPSGSDIHVMLALCRHSRQVVVTNEELNGPDMVSKLLGKGQRVADQS